MNGLQRFLLYIFGLTTSVVTTILVMKNGWGLEPKSWWWIIGVYYIGKTIALIIIEVSKQKGDK
jgi:RsiW-degrading membrane proteinase PrsW (M82 family)